MLFKLIFKIIMLPFIIVFKPLKWPNKLADEDNYINFYIAPYRLNIPILWLILWWSLLGVFYTVYTPIKFIIELIRSPKILVQSIKNHIAKIKLKKSRKGVIRG